MYKYWKRFTDRHGAYIIIRTYLNNTGKKVVPESSPKYQAWLDNGNTPTEITFNEPSLIDYKATARTDMLNLGKTRAEELVSSFDMALASFENPEVPGEFVLGLPIRKKYYASNKNISIEYIRLKNAINAANTLDEVDTAIATENYPTVLP